MNKISALLLLAAALPAGAQAPAPPAPAPAPAPAAPAPAAPAPRDNAADCEALRSAIDSRDIAKATALLDANPKIIKMRDQQRRLPLSHAVEYGAYGDDKDKTGMLSLLIARGADVNASDDQQGQTPLVMVISRGDMTVFNFLVDKGASLTAFGTDSQTPIHAAAAQRSVDMVNRLLSKGVDVNLRGGTGDTPLHAAAASGDIKTVRALLNSGANVNLRNDRGDTPFHVAMRLYGLSDNTAAQHSSFGSFYFLQSYRQVGGPGPDEAVRASLLAKGAQVGLRDQYGLTPLLYALLNRDKAGRLLLLRNHAPVDTQTAFFTAAALDDVPALTRLAATNPSLVTGRAPNGATPLHVAALWDARRSLAWLLKRGAETTARDAYALAPLHYACRAPDAQASVAALLAAGANVAAEDGAGDTPLHYAVRALAKDSVALLLAHHASVSARNGSGGTPLTLTPDASRADIVGLLLAAGADPNARPRWGGGSLLSDAAQSGARATVSLLLDHGADPNAQNSFGNGSPLLSAIQGRNKDIVALLLDHGADPTAKTPWGETLLKTAQNNGNDQGIVALLQKHLPPDAPASKPNPAK